MEINKKLAIPCIAFILLSVFFVNAGEICIDTTAPTAPANLKITDSPYDADGNIVLSWDAATDEPDCSGVDYYNIYRSINQTTGFVKIGQTNDLFFSDMGLSQGTTYYYYVTAVDKVKFNPHEGPLSNQAFVTIGTEPSQPPSNGGSTGGTGGSTGGTSSSCTPEWKLGEWTKCSPEGTQTRSYIDKNSCGTTAGKPEDQTQTCTYVPPKTTTTQEEETEPETTSGEGDAPTEGDDTPGTTTTEPSGGFGGITGMFFQNITGANKWKGLGVIILVLLVGYLFYFFVLKKKRKKE